MSPSSPPPPLSFPCSLSAAATTILILTLSFGLSRSLAFLFLESRPPSSNRDLLKNCNLHLPSSSLTFRRNLCGFELNHTPPMGEERKRPRKKILAMFVALAAVTLFPNDPQEELIMSEIVKRCREIGVELWRKRERAKMLIQLTNNKTEGIKISNKPLDLMLCHHHHHIINVDPFHKATAIIQPSATTGSGRWR
ncbi:hypothetical protein RIF29_17762 [Crotalaria pallida]|uniref:Uncharacterized protein n=1 Tax=Crotalaria pallida TaxID=3830 RepID=A0AAN9FJ06_CROPI